ncbi:hypothetical protein ACHWQZ_G005611 [Mnemiopsis leidyi]
METEDSVLWLFTSFSTNLTKKKKLRIAYPGGDLNLAFKTLCSVVLDKMLKTGQEVEVSKPDLVYKDERDLDKEGCVLEEASDLEGLLHNFPDGRGVRIIVNIDDTNSLDFRSVSTDSAMPESPLPSGSDNTTFSRSRSLSLKQIYDCLKRAANQPGPEESSYFVDPRTGRVHNVKLVDFMLSESSRGTDSSYGKVYEATYNGYKFAVKMINGILIDDEFDRPTLAFEREMTFLRKTTDWKCHNIVQFHGFFRKGRNAYLILELMDKDLSEVTSSLKRRGLYNRMSEEGPDFEAIGYVMLRDVANGLRFTHGANSAREKFMHRDIKSSNIMVKCSEHRFVIIDFGSTKDITGEDTKIHSMGAGQKYYEAPECREFKPNYCESCDIWSLGITFIKFLSGKHPIWDDTEEPSSSDDQNRNKVDYEIDCRIKGKDDYGEKYDWSIGLTSDYLSVKFKNLINSCVNRDPKKRPTAQNIYEIAKIEAESIDPLRISTLFKKFFENQ